MIFILNASCKNIKQNKTSNSNDFLAIPQNESEFRKSNIIEFDCDSIYKDKGYKLELVTLNTISKREIEYSFVLILTKKFNKQNIEIYRDTIESTNQEVKFCDFNNDKIKDILIQNISDVRSNWTYNLYLVFPEQNRIIKVKGFNEIKNPNYLSEYNLIDNYVNSGTNWTSFYKITNDSIIDFGIVIYDDLTENGTYKNEYEQAIKLIRDK